MTPLTAEKIAELERLLAAATPDWRLARNGVVTGGPFHEYPRGSAQSQLAMFCHMSDDEAWQEANAALAVAMHEALPYFLSLAKRVAGAPVRTVDDCCGHSTVDTSYDLPDDVQAAQTAEVQALIGKRVALVEIVGGEE